MKEKKQIIFQTDQIHNRNKINNQRQINKIIKAGRKKKMDQLARIKTIELTADFSIKIMEAEDFTAEFFLSEKNALT